MAFNPDNSARLYVANNGTFPGQVPVPSTAVSVISISGAGGSVTATITVGDRPESVVFNPVLVNGVRYAYATNASSDTVSVINATASPNTVVATIPVGSIPQVLAFNPAGTRLYVPNAGGSTLSVISTDPSDPQTYNTVIASPIVGVGPNAVAVNPVLINGVRYAYVANTGDSTVSVLDTGTLAQTVITVGGGTGWPSVLAVNPAGTRLYVTNGDFTNPTADTVWVISLDPNNQQTYNTVIQTITVGNNPRGIAINASGTRVYVANSTGTTISVIDTTTNPNTVIATLTAGQDPRGLAIDPAGAVLYVANNGADTVWAIPL